MTTTEKHEMCIELIHAKKYFERLIISRDDGINGFSGTFPSLKRKYIHDIEIYKRCIERLNLRYRNIINSL